MSRARPRRTGRRPTVLVVDDDGGFRLEVKAILQRHCEVLLAKDAGEALGIVRNESVDLALVDVHLPAFLAKRDSEEGLALIEVLKKRHGMKAMAISNSSGERLRRDCLDAGAVGFEEKQDLAVEKLLGMVDDG